MANFIQYVMGPRLFRLYRTEDAGGRDYPVNVLEYYCDCFYKTALFTAKMISSITMYASPVVASIMYRRGYFSSEGLLTLGRAFGISGMLFFVSMFLRGVGRFLNSDYITFISVLNAYKKQPSRELKLEVSKYDFDFNEWPVDFKWNQSTLAQKPKKYIEKPTRRGLEKWKSMPCGILSFLAIHTFGRMMIYPGSVGIMNALLWNVLNKGRRKLIEENKAERFKLLTREGNEIDSVFIDRRHDMNNSNGSILVICCEGNSGFYEFGITGTPIDAGYSVLGWNHPGFGYSTGTPFPDQELNAMDVVMQFAMSSLRFKEENIVLYAWSIGGFSATWAAMNYPNIRGLVLDATFDDLVALAVPRMPQTWKPLVVRTIRDYMDLNNAEQLSKYDGPVLLIRRAKDEIISSHPSRSLQTNRGNDLLIKLLQNRYPKLVTNETMWALREYVSNDRNYQASFAAQQGVEDNMCVVTLTSYVEENGLGFPMNIGEDLPTEIKVPLLLYLAEKHMIDFDSTHCIPLPSSMFHLPWRICFSEDENKENVPKSRM